jgi:drug/metabolite transporter (DMT)-like permease
VTQAAAVQPSHVRAALQAFFVTLLWSTSWVLIKLGLTDIPALTFAGLRYFLAFLSLIPIVLQSERRASLSRLTPRAWIRLAVLGVLYYSITQGTQFVGLAMLPAVTTSLLLSFSPMAVALLGMPMLGERPGRWQWGGIVLSLVGIVVFFYPIALPAGRALGITVVLLGTVTNALSSVLGRSVNRAREIDAITVTVISMGIGSALLLAGGIATQGLPTLSAANWAVVAWLAVVNTALAFTLWNQSLQTLPAVESSLINNTMLVQIAILAWLFLAETITGPQAAGMALVLIGALLVQLARPRVRAT